MYHIQERIKDEIIDFAIWLIKKVERHKNRCLSQRLYNLAEDYNTRPGTSNYDK